MCLGGFLGLLVASVIATANAPLAMWPGDEARLGAGVPSGGRPNASARNVLLRGGERRAQLLTLERRLWPMRSHAQLSVPARADALAGLIAGLVVDETVRPVAYATVSAQRIATPGLSARYLEEAATRTNADGEYELRNLPLGRYYVAVIPSVEHVSSTKLPRFGYAPALYPGTSYVQQASIVEVTQDRPVLRGIDVTVDRARLVSVAGTLVSMAGRLQDGTHISLQLAAAFGSGGFHSVARPDARGRFKFGNVPTGAYRLIARSIPERVVKEIAASGRSAPLTRASDSEFGIAEIDVGGTDVTDVVVRMTTGGRIQGRVTLEGRPLEPPRRRVFVRAEPTGVDWIAGGATEVLIEADGRFDIAGLAGTFVLRIDGDLPSGTWMSQVDWRGGDVTDQGLIVSPGEMVSSVEIALQSDPTELVASAPAEAEPKGDWFLVVFSQDVSLRALPATRFVRIAKFERGAARVVGLPPGRYLVARVQDAADGRWREGTYLSSVEKSAISVHLAPGEHRLVDLRRGRP